MTLRSWEDARVLALELSDATDDLNDALRRIEREFAGKGYPVGKTKLGLGLLEWDGTQLSVWKNYRRVPLLSSSREQRVAAAHALNALLFDMRRGTDAEAP